MLDIVREAPLGMLLNRLTGDRAFRHPEDKPGFEWTARSLKFIEKEKRIIETSAGSIVGTQGDGAEVSPGMGDDIEAGGSLTVTPASTKNETLVDPVEMMDRLQEQVDPSIVVDWYDDSDPDDP